MPWPVVVNKRGAGAYTFLVSTIHTVASTVATSLLFSSPLHSSRSLEHAVDMPPTLLYPLPVVLWPPVIRCECVYKVPLVHFSASFVVLLISRDMLPNTIMARAGDIPMSSSKAGPILIILAGATGGVRFATDTAPADRLQQGGGFAPVLCLLAEQPGTMSGTV